MVKAFEKLFAAHPSKKLAGKSARLEQFCHVPVKLVALLTSSSGKLVRLVQPLHA